MNASDRLNTVSYTHLDVYKRQIGIEYDKIEAGIRQIFGRKGEDIVNMNLKALKAGYDLAQSLR